jgi:hypothetical protein
MLGVCYIICVLIMFNIIVFNLIIAMLSNTYNIFDSKSNGLYLSKILNTRDEMSYDESYGAYLTGLPIINVLQIPGIPISVFKSRHDPLVKQVNLIIMKLQYFMFMTIFFVYFSILSVVLIPVAYIFGVIDKVTGIRED